MRAPAAALAAALSLLAALAAAPALAGPGVEGDAATSVADAPPAPFEAPIDPAAGAGAFERCAAATYVWLQVRPESVPEEDARFVYEAFLIALLERAYLGRAEGETDGAVEARTEAQLGLAVQRYLASFKAPAFGGSAEGLLAGDLAACQQVIAAHAEASRPAD